MRHNKTFKKGHKFEDVIYWLQDVVKFDEVIIPSTHDLDHPDTECVIIEDYNISIMKVTKGVKHLGNG